MRFAIVSAGLSLALAGSASAVDTLVSLTYGDLSGNYTASSATQGTYTARAVDLPGILRSSGNVSRLIPTTGVADFQPGFVSGADLSDFVLTMSITHGATTGTGTGSFTATDADGDTVTGNLSGDWFIEGVYLAFVGTLSNVRLNDNGSQDGTFNGSNSGAWNMNFPGYTQPFDGAIVKLTEQASNFFQSNFTNAAAGLTAQVTAPTIIPLPPAALAGMFMLSGLGLVRSRRW